MRRAFPAAALERDMVSLGVAEKQKDKARQVFERSAEQSDFFYTGRMKLVMPAFPVKADSPPPQSQYEEPVTDRKKSGGSGGISAILTCLS